jgi:hypothetical protein
MGCSNVGETSAEVLEYDTLVLHKKYDIIKQNLFSSSLAEQFLSLIVLTELTKDNVLSLNEAEKERIQILKGSNTKYVFCEGCQVRRTGKFSDLFKTKSGKMTFEDIIRWYHL